MTLYYIKDQADTPTLVSFLRKNPELLEITKTVELKEYFLKHRQYPRGIRGAPTLLEDRDDSDRIRAIEGGNQIISYYTQLKQWLSQVSQKQNSQQSAPVHKERSSNNSASLVPENPAPILNVRRHGASIGFDLQADQEKIMNEDWTKIKGNNRVPEGKNPFAISVEKGSGNVKNDLESFQAQRKEMTDALRPH